MQSRVRGCVCISEKKTEFEIAGLTQHFRSQNSVFSLDATKFILSFGALKKKLSFDFELN